MKNSSQYGMTLIEIMVALLIGAFILGGVLESFVGSKQTNRLLESLSRVQENGRYAMQYLTDDIRMAGFVGCGSPLTLSNSLNTPTSFLYNFTVPVEGFEATSPTTWTPDITAAGTGLPFPIVGNSDVITLRRAGDQGFTVTTHATATDPLTLDASATSDNLKANRILNPTTGANNCATAVASNCTVTTAFQITNVAGTDLSHAAAGCAPGNATNDLGRTYENGQVFPINTITYFINTNTAGQPSLYKKVGLSNSQELVEGIEQMQILYGIYTGTASNKLYYITADQLAALNPITDRIVSVRISLVAISTEQVLSNDFTFNFNNISVTDRFLRRVFTSTISIRN